MLFLKTNLTSVCKHKSADDLHLQIVQVFLYEQFRFFFNLYFLLVALTQFIPVLQVGMSHVVWEGKELFVMS